MLWIRCLDPLLLLQAVVEVEADMKRSLSFSRNLTILAIAGGLFHACGSASFKGDGGGSETTRNLQPTAAPMSPVSPSNRGTAPLNPGMNPAVNPSVPRNTTTNTVQTIGGIVNQIRNNIDVTRTDREIVFGGNKVFHIGDGRFPASSCQRQLQAYDLSGTKYAFEFEVTEDATTLEMDVLTVCGVDYSDSNSINLVQKDGNTLRRDLIRAGVSRAGLRTMTVGKGRYEILVESGRNTSAGVEGGDNDDFIVGQVRIRASKNINPGNVRVE